MAKGIKSGGRQKGTPNKINAEVAARLAGLGCDPIEGMVKIALRECECPTCQGTLRAKYTLGPVGIYLDPDSGKMMTCRTCWGTGKEPILPELRGKMFAELAQYIAPKRKAIEHSPGDGVSKGGFMMVIGGG